MASVPVVRRVLRAYDVSFEGPDERGGVEPQSGQPEAGEILADLLRHAATFAEANPEALLKGIAHAEHDGRQVLTLFYGDVMGRDLDGQLTHDVHVIHDASASSDPPA